MDWSELLVYVHMLRSWKWFPILKCQWSECICLITLLKCVRTVLYS